MIRARFAFETGLIDLPVEGIIGVFGAQIRDDLAWLPAERVEIVQGSKPEVDALASQGFIVRQVPNSYAMSIVVVPRARRAAEALLAKAMAATEGLVIVTGAKSDGVESLLKDCRRLGQVGAVAAKAHGKVFVVEGGNFSAWTAKPAQTKDGYWTAPGVFSADGPDAGSVLLAECLPEPIKGQGADLGAGWGFLSARLLQNPAVKALNLVEADLTALDCARRNVEDPRAAFHWADATSWTPPEALDFIVMNPPFHKGRDSDIALGQAFITSAARMLSRHGRLWLVANRHLRYETHLAQAFGHVREFGGDNRFKLIEAAKAKR